MREVRLERAERGGSRALMGLATEVRRFLSLLRWTRSSSMFPASMDVGWNLRRGESARGVRGVRGARADRHRDFGRSSSVHSWTDM